MEQKNRIAKIANSLNMRRRWREWRERSKALHALETSASVLRACEFIAALVVLVGIVGEYVEPFRKLLHEMPWWRALLKVWPGAAVAGGIALETLFSMLVTSKENRIQSVLRQEAAQTRERAANAERETEQIKKQAAWRMLDQTTVTAIIASLQQSPGSVWVDFFNGDFESQYYAQQFWMIFTAAGWKVVMRGVTPNFLAFGLMLPEPNPHSRRCEAGLLQAIAGKGIPFSIGAMPGTVGAFNQSGSMEDAEATDAARLFVGPKYPTLAKF
jgi:hypothetical protein